jgi:SAM-dependent methyltransferase
MSDFYISDPGKEYYKTRKKRRDPRVHKLKAQRFARYIKAEDKVLDIGCGNGGIIANIPCKKKIGVEVNPPSIEEARKAGIEIFEDIASIPDESIDCVISNHALEHMEEPAAMMRQASRVLKPGGTAVLVVPLEIPFGKKYRSWRPEDPDRHLYAWTPLAFGNLVETCELKVRECGINNIGYSGYILPFRNTPLLFPLLKIFVAFLLKRYEVRCVAVKETR